MIFDSRTYSALVVSSSQKMSSQISDILSQLPCNPIICVSDISSAKREFLEKSFDFVIINSPLPDGAGIRFAIDVCSSDYSVCLLMLKTEDFEEVESRVSGSGVFTLQKPISSQTFSMSVKFLKAARERLRPSEKKALTLEDRMEEIRIINRAKWVLISKQNMTEEEAHKYIEKQAMNTCSTKVEIAKSIIENVK